MTTQQFAARLQAKLEATTAWYVTDSLLPDRILRASVLGDVSDCIRHALVEPPETLPRKKRRKTK